MVVILDDVELDDVEVGVDDDDDDVVAFEELNAVVVPLSFDF